MVATAKKAGARYLIFTVFHSCGRYSVNYPTQVPGHTWKATEDYFGALVERCHGEGVHLLVYLAACTEHGWIKDGPQLTEEMRDQKNVYAAVTQMIHEIIDQHGEKIGGVWFDGNYSDELGNLVHTHGCLRVS